jgi:hypothetical protein
MSQPCAFYSPKIWIMSDIREGSAATANPLLRDLLLPRNMKVTVAADDRRVLADGDKTGLRGGLMLKRSFQLLLVTCLATGALSAADNPFVGDWKLDLSRTKLIDVMKVESLGANKYGFDLGGGSAEKIAVNGTDQPGLSGTTLSVTVEGQDTWKVVRKKDGRILVTGIWKLSQDGNTLSDNYTEFAPNGSPHSYSELPVQTNRSRDRFCGDMGSHDDDGPDVCASDPAL